MVTPVKGIPLLTFYECISLDGIVKSPYIVIPYRIGVRDDGQAGIQNHLILLDPGLRRGDETSRVSALK